MLKVVLTVDSHISFEYKKLVKQDKKCYVELIRAFTYSNPTYYKNEKMHFSNKGIPKKIETYKKLKHEIVFNRGGIKKIKTILKKHGHTVKIHDHRLEFNPVTFNSNIMLRSEQREPVRKMISKKQGIVRGPCSCISGDTNVFIRRGDKEFYIKVERLLHHIESGNFDNKPTLIQAVNMQVPPKLVWTKIEDVVATGKRYTVNLKLENKVELRATPDHAILTPNGYKLLGDITNLDEVFVDLSRPHVEPIRVVSVSKPKFVQTYDISCPEHRCFTANDVVIHNSGKTVMLYDAIAKAKQPTVVIVWNTIHQKQWMNEAQKFLGLKKSEIGGCGGIFKKPKFGILNICMQQSLCKDEALEFFTDRVGFVGLDECLSPNTWVALRNGHKQLKHIKVGDEVRTPNGNFTKVVGKSFNRKKAYRYTTNNKMVIVASKDHPVATGVSNSKRTGTMACHREIKEIGECDNLELYTSDYYTKHNYSALECFFGWFVADGTLDRGRYLKFAFRKDSKVERLVHVSKEAGLHPKISKNRRGDIIVSFGASGGAFIKKHGFQTDKKANTVYAPKWLFKKCSVGFLQGLFDADGNFSKDGVLELSTTSLRLARQVKLMLASIGIHSSLFTIGRKGENHSTSYRVSIFNIGIKRFYDVVGLNVKPKCDYCLDYISKILPKHKRYEKITKVEKLGYRNLIDIELENEEKLFIANGFVVHNCQRYAANTYEYTINQFPAKYRIGVSANERRKDGKQFLIYDSIGKVICEMKDKDVGSRRPSRVFLIPTDFHSEEYDETQNHVNLLTEMSQDNDRNKLILKAVKRSIKNGKQCLILTERKYQALYFKYALKGYSVGLLVGETSSREIRESGWRDEWKKFMKSYDSHNAYKSVKSLGEKKKLDVIIATQKGDVGVNIRTIDHMFITTPTGTNMERFNQQKGRCERDYNVALEEKFGVKATPHVYYFWDVNHEKLQKAGNSVLKKYNGQILKLKGE